MINSDSRYSKWAVGLLAAVVLQGVVLVGMVVKAALPLWTGTPVKVATVPVDPRSWFRGNYARLNYGFERIPAGDLPFGTSLRIGEVVYVRLVPGSDGLYEYGGASLTQPENGVFLRGRLTDDGPPYRVNFGIDAYFAPKERALQLERELRNGGVAVLMVTDSGRVALKAVEANREG
ncbi:Uncharacterised protein [BD1-7 clade bacterium]|uniref:GDYXXLXY domain-containing protein n=1 Tax=BD1-7 clade bacterium TaxID=2029982 RepID=A0A5S9PJD3_9GAMM|nr:Uncharacterised protein [BD1-7 clade bacterium]CAA0104232.1 Uncharacterised protein [BD1-7 clade bacterium]